MKAGEPIELNVPFSGSPAPEIKWTRDDQKAVPGVDTGPEFTKLLIPVSKRTDSAYYTIKATNKFGEAEATVKITVIGGLR